MRNLLIITKPFTDAADANVICTHLAQKPVLYRCSSPKVVRFHCMWRFGFMEHHSFNHFHKCSVCRVSDGVEKSRVWRSKIPPPPLLPGDIYDGEIVKSLSQGGFSFKSNRRIYYNGRKENVEREKVLKFTFPSWYTVRKIIIQDYIT